MNKMMSKRLRIRMMAFIMGLMIMTVTINTTEVQATSLQLKDVPIGSIVYDPSWEWEHKTGNGYTGSGVLKPVEWEVVAKNHPEYPTDSVTLVGKELVAKYAFDTSKNISRFGSNHWGNSNKIKPFLNTTFHNEMSKKFKESILTTSLPNADQLGANYITQDKIFVPSETELGGVQINTHKIGTSYGYYSNNAKRIKNNGAGVNYYWTRSPDSGTSYSVRHVTSDGSVDNDNNSAAFNENHGVLPALNLESNVYAKKVSEGRYEIAHQEPNTPPDLSLTEPAVGATINPEGKITISGTVTDPDTDTITVSATIGGKTRSTIVTGPVTNESWTLSWTGEELAEGAYESIDITTSDGMGGIDNKIYTGKIIVDKTPPTLKIIIK